MKKLLLITALVIIGSACSAQKKHIYRDTIKTVKEHVEYEPDTIPVYFKEVYQSPVSFYSDELTIIERWYKGFVVWQTWKPENTAFITLGSTSTGIYWGDRQETTSSYKDPYQFTKSLPGTFLYVDKSHCKNLVICCIKR